MKSFAQQGFAGFGAPTWWAFLGRAGTPPGILKRMEDALHDTLATPDVRARIEEQGADVAAGGPDQCRTFLAREVQKWEKVIRDNNITLDS